MDKCEGCKAFLNMTITFYGIIYLCCLQESLENIFLSNRDQLTSQSFNWQISWFFDDGNPHHVYFFLSPCLLKKVIRCTINCDCNNVAVQFTIFAVPVFILSRLLELVVNGNEETGKG